MNKSLKYVYRALRLLELPEKALKALERGDITPAHAHQILRAPQEKFEALVKYATTRLEWQKRYPTVDELKERIERTIEKDLGAAPFPKDVTYAGAVACTGCPFNTGNQGALFDGATKGHCTNPGCFNKKTAAFYKELQSEGTTKFQGLKFIGAAAESGYGTPQIKGAYIVQKVDEKMKKAMQAKPDQFGFGIVKPARWGGKKARLVVLCKDAKLAGIAEPKAAPAYREPTPEERQRDEFIRRHVEKTYYVLALEKVSFEKQDLIDLLEHTWDDEWRRRRIMPLLEAAGIDADAPEYPRAALETKSRETLIQLVLLSLLSTNDDEMSELLDSKKAKVQEVLKKAQGEALKRWTESHPTAA